jgi:hypothetical protein
MEFIQAVGPLCQDLERLVFTREEDTSIHPVTEALRNGAWSWVFVGRFR